MRSIGKTLVAAVFALVLVASAPSQAQAQWFLAGSAGMSAFSGSDWDHVNSGFQAQGAIGSRLGQSFSLAGLFSWSTHGTDADNIALPCVGCTQPGEDNVNALTIELQPTVRFGPADGTSFWIGARGGYASIGADEKATGLILGPVAGVGFPLSDRASLGLAGSWSALNLSHDLLAENLKGGKWGLGAYVLVALGG